jgi:hypothetical protein
VGEEFETSMSLPLDSDGFLRRQCPTCERELKWLAEEEEGEESLAEPEGGYFCPYCAIQAPGDSWWTEAQAELAKSILLQEFIDPQLDEFQRGIERLNQPGGLISISVERDKSEPADPLTEVDDMRRVDFACHPGAAVKVLEDWTRDVHCPICGATTVPR